MHHASSILAIGDASSIPALLKQEGIKPGSPDVYIKEYRKFGIDDALEIQRRASLQPVADDQRTFVLYVPSATPEAQNALLKTLEEPRANSKFYFLNPSPLTFLPTVLSRSEVRHIAGAERTESMVHTADFLAASPAQRLEMLKPLYEHDEDEGRDIGPVIAFLQSLEREYAAAGAGKARAEGLRAVYRARKYATDKGSLLKSLLEQVALLAPKL